MNVNDRTIYTVTINAFPFARVSADCITMGDVFDWVEKMAPELVLRMPHGIDYSWTIGIREWQIMDHTNG